MACGWKAGARPFSGFLSGPRPPLLAGWALLKDIFPKFPTKALFLFLSVADETETSYNGGVCFSEAY
jgi:hypothetical protein